jgi:hypothetical protein
VQAGLDLCWSQTHYVGFGRDEAHMSSCYQILEVFLKLETHHMTFNVLVWHKTQQRKKN